MYLTKPVGKILNSKNEWHQQKFKRTSLLHRLQAQTFPNEAPTIGKIHPFSKIAVAFELVMRFGCPLGFIIS